MDQAPQTNSRKKPQPKTSSRASSKSPAAANETSLPGLAMPDSHLAEARSRQILAAMMALSDGDFQARLPSDWSGTDGRIAEAFNQAIRYAGHVTSEAERVRTTVGKEGRLSQRMSAPGAIGGWADQVQSLNTLMDDLVRPTTDIARTIGAVAKGDLGQSMDLQVDGRAL